MSYINYNMLQRFQDDPEEARAALSSSAKKPSGTSTQTTTATPPPAPAPGPLPKVPEIAGSSSLSNAVQNIQTGNVPPLAPPAMSTPRAPAANPDWMVVPQDVKDQFDRFQSPGSGSTAITPDPKDTQSILSPEVQVAQPEAPPTLDERWGEGADRTQEVLAGADLDTGIPDPATEAQADPFETSGPTWDTIQQGFDDLQRTASEHVR